MGYFRKKVAWIMAILMSVTLLFGLAQRTVSAAENNAVADDLTVNHWHNSIAIDDTTKNIGRIWTDKSVSAGDMTMSKVDSSSTKKVEKKTDSDFLISLSALSSAAKIMGQSAVPLDIVMVLDVSGSMGDDNKMSTLKTAVNSFIDESAKANTARANENLSSRISLVKFSGKKTDKIGNDTYRDSGYTYNYTQIVKGYKAYTNDNKNEIKNAVNALQPAGATAADYAMDQAKTLVDQSKTDEAANTSRKNVKRVVIFFTDGEPNHNSGFDDTVANNAIQTAKTIKADASMFSIGVFKNADDSITTGGSGFFGSWTDKEKFNTYMHGMSSNYPGATAYDNLGTRATNAEGVQSSYYKAATNVSDINAIFNTIQEEIIATAQSPTEVEQGKDPNQSGYITLVDKLGDYMQVDDMNTLLYADNICKYTDKKEVKDGNKTIVTYTFDKEIPDTNHVYPTGNLKNIQITVEKSDLKTGDKVTVKIPASLIPLRYYEVSKDNKMSIDAIYPCRLFYDVSLKADAQKKLENPDADMKSYIEANTTADGQVAFYANKYNKNASGEEGEGIGAYSTFVPAASNDFYYFQEDKTLYKDKECTIPEKDDIDTSGQTTYYYQREYYDKDASGNAKKEINTVTIPGNSNIIVEGYAKQNTKTSEWYIPAGTPRTTSLSYFTENKADGANKSKTSNRLVKPVWENNYTGKNVHNYLGNNGRITKDLPGELDIRKIVRSAEGHKVPDSLKNQEFTYKLELKDAAKDGYVAQKFVGADKTGDEFTIKSGDTFKLKHNETLKIYGLEGGATYTVTEAKAAHFDGNVSQQNAGNAASTGTDNDGGVFAKGTITAKDTSVVDYTNTYEADAIVVPGSESFKIQKDFVDASGNSAWDMDYLKDAKFQFILSPADNSNPMPNGAAEVDGVKIARLEVNSKDAVTKAFGNIEYTKPGTYEYLIIENNPGTDRKQGVSYSGASYKVVVTVTDKDGKLHANAVMTKTRNDNGEELESPSAVSNNTAVFKNVYDAKEQSVVLSAGKEFTDRTGTKTLQDGDYKFTLTPITAGAPLPAGASGKMEASNIGNGVKFGSVTFTANHVKGATKENPLTYEYKIKEVLPEGANASNNYTVDGITYDNSEYKVRINVYIDTVDGKDTVIVDRDYLDPNGKEMDAAPIFHNSYEAAPAVLTQDTDTALKGEKTLKGRDTKDGESFNFKLTPDAETKKAIEKKEISIDENGDRASVTGLKNKEAKAFHFGNVTFKKEGIYHFDINEVVPDPQAGGMTYDRHVTNVSVKVIDDKEHPGKLKATVTYNNGTASDAKDKAVFVNNYKASIDYGSLGGFNIEKVLNGRTMKAEEFDFQVLYVNGSLSRYSNPNQRASGEVDTIKILKDWTYDQDSVGKKTSLEIEEIKWGIKGITYDERKAYVDITPYDNGDGTMHMVTKVTMKNPDGSVDYSATYDSSDPDSGVPSVRFVNTYKAAAADPISVITGFNKEVTGREWKDNDAFTFKLTNTAKPAGVEKAPMPEKDEVTVTKKDAVDGKAPITFGKIKYEKAGVYKYQLKEQVPDSKAAGMTYDTAAREITVTVTDDGTGKLIAAVTAVSGNKTFANEYSTKEIPFDDVCAVRMTKKLVGRDMKEDDFSFTIKGADEASAEKLNISAGNGATIPGKAGADGEAVTLFDGLGFKLNHKDIGKTYTYVFDETKGDKKGIVYDENEYTLQVKVKDGGDGNLLADVVLSDKSGKELFHKTVSEANSALGEKGVVIPFENRYDASTDVSGGAKAEIKATKTLNGRNLKAGEFTFELQTKPGDGKEGSVLQTKKNNADGMISFDPLSYKNNEKAAGADAIILKKAMGEGYATKATKDGKDVYTLNYRLVEKQDSLPAGVTATRGSFDISVEVTDNNDGTLTAKTIYPENAGKCEFVNTYGNGEAIPVQLNGSKTLAAAEGLTPPDISGKFTFTLEAITEGAPMPEKTSVTNDGNGNVNFGTMKFDINDLKDVEESENGAREKTFQYKVTESGNVPGVINDTNGAKEFALTLKDDGAGNLSVVRKEATDNLFIFTNTYKVESTSTSVTDQIHITKKLEGRDLKADEFKFQLLENDKVVSEAKNDADGNITFDKITYTEPGTHTYKVCEVDEGVNGVTYDTAIYNVFTRVTDTGKGTLKVDHRIDQPTGDHPTTDGNVTFTNKYKAKDTSVELGAVKKLTGKKLKDGEFTFLLENENGEELARAKNKADGSVQFKAIKFDKAGEYTYQIREVNDGKDNVTYDENVYKVTVKVTDNLEGALVAEVTGKEPVFTNKYVKDKKPDPKPGDEDPEPNPGPKPGPRKTHTGARTGDESGFVEMLVLFVVAGAVMTMSLRKKRR